MVECKCGKIGSSRCIDGRCRNCCANSVCKEHPESVNNDNYNYNHDGYYYQNESDELIDIKNEINDEIIEMPVDITNIIIGYIDEREECSECQALPEYLCKCERCGDIICENKCAKNIFVPHNRKKCKYCKIGSCNYDRIKYYCETCISKVVDCCSICKIYDDGYPDNDIYTYKCVLCSTIFCEECEESFGESCKKCADEHGFCDEDEDD